MTGSSYCYKKKTNYPISSNSNPSATANITMRFIKEGGLQNQLEHHIIQKKYEALHPTSLDITNKLIYISCNCINYMYFSQYSSYCFCPQVSRKRGDIKSHSSVCPSVRPSVCPSVIKNFNLDHVPWFRESVGTLNLIRPSVPLSVRPSVRLSQKL